MRRRLVQAAHAAAHSKNTYLAAQYHRIASRRGAKKAALAVAHSILVITYHLLRNRSTYQELGGNSFDERDRQAVEKRLVRRLERMGYQAELQLDKILPHLFNWPQKPLRTASHLSLDATDQLRREVIAHT